ncbi:MAG: SAM-dependent methyltransferase [Lachnospiraceae bacterium]
MSKEMDRIIPIHLKEEEVLDPLPGQIGKVSLNYDFYPGEDLYSDGQIEEEILAIVKDEARVDFPRIIEERKSWPVLYHLSYLRGNIVDWLPIKPGDKVLEIGSGCGAITEKLAQKAGKVTCVDLSARRSHINAWRNQERDNIEIYVGNFNEIEPVLAEDYDFACMIGVFEYGQSYIPSSTPYEDFLRIMQKHVKKEGSLVIAIENKLGLKYWAGCKEDHVGTYFSGLEGYPEGGSARTFTRKGLEKIFESCGIKEYSFYYPYPDYKLPTTIYSDRRLPRTGELTDNLRNFDRDRMLLFNEKYVYDSIIQDGLFSVFANSFLVVIGNQPEISYVKYSNDRAAEYALRTEILETDEGKVVRKVAMNEEAVVHLQKLPHYCRLLKERYAGSGLCINECSLAKDGSYVQFVYEEGVTLENCLDDCLNRDDLEGFYRLFDQYYRYISYGEENSVADYDLIFANILIHGEKWTIIDYEWTLEQSVSTKEIAFRALYCYILAEERRNRLNLDALMERMGIGHQEAEEYRKKESCFQKRVTGKRKAMGEIRGDMGWQCIDVKVLTDRYLAQIPKRRIQIYFDRGKGFSEEESCYLTEVYVDETHMEAEIALDGNVHRLRIDPADHACLVEIEALLLNGEQIPLDKKHILTNGKMIEPEKYVFATSDPNMEIEVSRLSLKGENCLKMKLEVTLLPRHMGESIAKSMKERRRGCRLL